MNLKNISEREKDILLTHFFHYLPFRPNDEAGQNCRHVIGSEYPGIYNKLCERAVVHAVWPHERERQEEELEKLTTQLHAAKKMLQELTGATVAA